MKFPFLNVLSQYAVYLTRTTGIPSVITPSQVHSEQFHVELTLLAHPVWLGNGLAHFRVRATAIAEIPPTDSGINDALKKSLDLAEFYSCAQGFHMGEIVPGRKIYGTSYPRPLREDDELFADLVAEERSYSYSESWLVELEFDIEDIRMMDAD